MNTPTVVKPFGPRKFLTAMSECGRPTLTKPMFICLSRDDCCGRASWRARRRHAAHKVWLRRGHVIYDKPARDDRDWSGSYMNSVKKGHR